MNRLATPTSGSAAESGSTQGAGFVRHPREGVRFHPMWIAMAVISDLSAAA
jgi:hypothetical protein